MRLGVESRLFGLLFSFVFLEAAESGTEDGVNMTWWNTPLAMVRALLGVTFLIVGRRILILAFEFSNSVKWEDIIEMKEKRSEEDVMI